MCIRDSAYVAQRIEDIAQFDGKTITVSFDYKSDNDFGCSFEYHFGSGGSSSLYDKHGNTISASATVKRASVTVTLDDISGKSIGEANTSHLDLLFNMTANNKTFEITNVQLEVGNVATPFEHRSYAEELVLCQRYWQQSYDSGTPAGTAYGGSCYKGNNLMLFDQTTGWTAAENRIVFPVELRTAPTVTWYGVNTGAVGKAGNTFCASTTDTLTLGGTTASSKGLSHYPQGSGYPAGPWGANWTADAEL